LKYVMFVIGMMAIAVMILFSGFALPTVVALIILVLAVSSDFATTIACLRKGRKEGNPGIAFLFKKIGVPVTFGLLACIWVAFIVFRWLPSSPGIQTAVALVYWVVPVNNLIVLVKVSRKYHAEQQVITCG